MTRLIFRTTREKRIPLGRWDPPAASTRPSGWNVYFYIVEKQLATPDPAKTGNVWGEGFDKAERLGKRRVGLGREGKPFFRKGFPSLSNYYRSKITLQATAT
jgi:hypothetical protein